MNYIINYGPFTSTDK